MTPLTTRKIGNAPLKFEGELIAESSGRRQFGREHNRWHDLAIYRTAKGQYVAHVTYSTQWQGEAPYAQAVIVGSAEAAVAFFQAYDPLAHVTGYPPGEAYEEKRARLNADVRSRYDDQVSAILNADEFAEEI